MYKLKYAIPDMTSNTAPSGTVFYSSQFSDYYAWKVFDYENGTFWWPTDVCPQYIGYQFPTAKIIHAYSFLSRYNVNGGYPSSFQFQGSNDNSNWTTLDTQEDRVLEGTDTSVQFFSINNETAYIYYRLYITEVIGPVAKVILHTLKMYEPDIDFIESIPAMTSNTTPSGVASASSVASTGYEEYRAFDKIDEAVGCSFVSDLQKGIDRHRSIP